MFRHGEMARNEVGLKTAAPSPQCLDPAAGLDCAGSEITHLWDEPALQRSLRLLSVSTSAGASTLAWKRSRMP
jgi:hypothetical protein